MNMGYEAAGKNLDKLLEQLDKEPLSDTAKNLKKKVKDAITKP